MGQKLARFPRRPRRHNRHRVLIMGTDPTFLHVIRFMKVISQMSPIRRLDHFDRDGTTIFHRVMVGPDGIVEKWIVLGVDHQCRYGNIVQVMYGGCLCVIIPTIRKIVNGCNEGIIKLGNGLCRHDFGIVVNGCGRWIRAGSVTTSIKLFVLFGAFLFQ